jgi:hypothetical protein
MVAHSCNPSYSGGGDFEDVGQDQTGQKVNESPISTNMAEIVVCICNPSYMEEA